MYYDILSKTLTVNRSYEIKKSLTQQSFCSKSNLCDHYDAKHFISYKLPVESHNVLNLFFPPILASVSNSCRRRRAESAFLLPSNVIILTCTTDVMLYITLILNSILVILFVNVIFDCHPTRILVRDATLVQCYISGCTVVPFVMMMNRCCSYV